MYLSSSIARFLRGVKLLLSRLGVRKRRYMPRNPEFKNRYPYFAYRGSSADTHGPRITAQKRLARIIIRDARGGSATRGICAWDPLFRRVYPLPRSSEWDTPSTAYGSPRLAPPRATGHRPGVAVPGRRAWRRRTARGLARLLLRAHVRALQRKEVRVARSVTKFTAFALRCVQCT